MAAHYHHHQHHPTHTHTTTPTTITTLQLEPSAWNHRISTLFCCCYYCSCLSCNRTTGSTTTTTTRTRQRPNFPDHPPPQWAIQLGLTPTLHAERLQIINTYMNTLYNPTPKIIFTCAAMILILGHVVVFVLSAQREREMDGIGRRGGEYNTVMGVLWLLWVVTIMGFIFTTVKTFNYVRLNLFRYQSEWSAQGPVSYTFNNLQTLWLVSRVGVSLSLTPVHHMMIMVDPSGAGPYLVQQMPVIVASPPYGAQHAAVFMTASNTPQHVPCGAYGMQLEQQQYLPPYSGPSIATQQPPKYA